jgi:hypothetical protein
VSLGGDAGQLALRHQRPGRVGRGGQEDRPGAFGPAVGDEPGGQLVVGHRPDRDADRQPLAHADQIAVARIAGIGQQHLVIRVDGGGQRQQQRPRSPGGDDDLPRRYVHAETVCVIAADGLPQLGDPERRRVADPPVGDRLGCRLHDRRRGPEVGLTDLEMNDRPPGPLRRPGGFHHIDDPERLNRLRSPRQRWLHPSILASVPLARILPRSFIRFVGLRLGFHEAQLDARTTDWRRVIRAWVLQVLKVGR